MTQGNLITSTTSYFVKTSVGTIIEYLATFRCMTDWLHSYIVKLKRPAFAQGWQFWIRTSVVVCLGKKLRLMRVKVRVRVRVRVRLA